MGLIDKFNKGLDKTVNKLDDAITRAGEDDKAHIDRYVKDLGLSDKVKAEAQDILTKASVKDSEGKELVYSGRNRAGACVYIAAQRNGEHKSLEDVARVAHTVQSELRKYCLDVKDKLKIDVEIEEVSSSSDEEKKDEKTEEKSEDSKAEEKKE